MRLLHIIAEMIFQLCVTIKIGSIKSEVIYDDSAAKVMRLKCLKN